MPETKCFDSFARTWLPALDQEMRTILAPGDETVAPFYGMMHYQMGWVDGNFQAGSFASGKRVRPLLCLMACAAVEGDPVQALSAAAGLEILHNFSLIHDDIEDGDEVRRHRPTVWKQWNMPQAVNAGDGMFALAYHAFLRLRHRGDVSTGTTVAALARLTQTCLDLTEGQHLDLSFEDRVKVSIEEYLRMIGGKTASLIAASLSIGALVGGASSEIDEALFGFGHNIGLAFQIRDDVLGIWGDPTVTGKAAGNDLLRQKKSLPILYALQHSEIGERLMRVWRNTIGSEQLPAVMEMLELAEARSYAEEQIRFFHDEGVAALESALGVRAASSPLMELADGLLERRT